MAVVGVVEDSEIIRELLTEVLEAKGHDVRTCATLEGARKAFCATPPELLLVDIGLPDGSGLDLIREMRRLHPPETLPVVILSGAGEEEDLISGFDAGASDYLTKPLSLGEISAKCALLLAKRRPSTRAMTASLEAGLPGGEARAFGRYRLKGLLGQGGSGVVYDAWDLEADRPVALKVLHSVSCAQEEARRRFVREIYTLTEVRHPSLVSVYDYGAEGGRLYYAMERVEGITLAEHVEQKGPLSEDELLRVLTGLAGALCALDEAGLVHRDLKPQNIILAAGSLDRPVLIDFGLAKSCRDRSLTQPGEVLGTPSFMTPEAVRGLELDARADLFSLGMVAIYCLTGREPFHDRSYMALLQAIASEEVPLPEGTSLGLRAVLRSLTRLRPEDRLPSAAALLEELERVRHERATGCVLRSAG
ncbi:MAG: response regulator [Planctomycetota bacterium]|nr:MAG: response regulator [Planctomycetota bacterium]